VREDRWTRVALIVLSIAASVYLLEKLLQVSRFFGDVILLFLLSWFVAFVLDPAIDLLSKRLRRSLATTTVYLGLVLVILAFAVSFTPGLITQFSRMSVQIPNIIDQAPTYVDNIEALLGQHGLRVDLTGVLQAEDMAERVGSASATVVQSMLSLIMGIANVLANLLIVLLLSFYMTLDGDRITRRILRMIPRQARREVVGVVRSIDVSFGGFIRGQLIQGLIFAAGTFIVAWIAGLENVAAIGLLAGVLILIPLFGIPLSLIPPVAMAFAHSPLTALWVGVVLFVLQQAVINFLMPRIMGEMVGLNPLLIILALILGLRIGGIWGGFFAIPVAGVVYATILSLYQRRRAVGRSLG
jgi:predicted PurR-regulated permease PerM